jgi:hypothetical protein
MIATNPIPGQPTGRLDPGVAKRQVADTERAFEVLDSGVLAISSGPVRDSKGALIAAFTSIWQLEDTGKWRIIFDKGNLSSNAIGVGKARSDGVRRTSR